MKYRFTIRPKSIQGESLTSYLMRIADRNYIRIIDLIKILDRKSRINLRNFYKFDFNFECSIDISNLVGHLNCHIETIEEMTFCYLYKKMLAPEEYFDEGTREVLPNTMIFSKRKFCSECLSEEKIYKRLWQIGEIEICDKHLIKLQSQCPHCGKEQPYVHDLLAMGRCKYCSNLLATNNKNNQTEDSDFIHDQMEKYNEWEYLLRRDTTCFPNIVPNPRKSIAISLFYLCQGKESLFNIVKMQSMTKDYKYSLLRFLKDEENCSRPTIPIIQRISRELNIRFEEYENLDIPNAYIDSIFDFGRSIKDEFCLAPWCDSYGKNNLISLKIKSSTHGKIQMCKECSVKYGYNKITNDWEEYGAIIKLGWQQVLPMINEGKTQLSISVELNLTRYSVLELTEYFARHQLISENFIQKFKPREEKTNLIGYFEELMSNKGINIHLSTKLFGWTRAEYFYYFFDPQVQVFINTRNIKIAVPNKSAKTKIVYISPKNESLEYKKKAELFVMEKNRQKERITNADFFQAMGKGEKWLKSNCPDLLEWFNREKEMNLTIVKQEDLRVRLHTVQKAITNLIESGISISFENVSNNTGYSYSYLKKNPVIRKEIVNSRNLI